MRRHLRLLREFVRVGLVEEFEYRANFAANLIMTLLSIGLSLLTVTLFFYRSDALGGWSYYEVLTLLGIYNAISGFMSFALEPAMSRLVQHVRKGTLDYVLLRPADSQFQTTLRHLSLWRSVDIALGLGLAAFAAWKAGGAPSAAEAGAFVVLFASSMAILYSLWLAMMTMSFWAVKVDNLSFLFSSLFETARYPVTVYRGALKLALLYVIPIGFVTTVPAEALTGRLTAGTALASVAIAAVALLASRRLWRWAIRHYTSASS